MLKNSANSVKMQLDSRSVNEAFSRAALAAFLSPLDPDFGEMCDLRTAISEAVTNCIVHGYKGNSGIIYINLSYYDDRTVKIVVRDKGCGIEDIKQAMQPLFTTDRSGERGGMGFTVMKSFCDKMRVTSKVGKGTSVFMEKKLR